MSATRTGRWLLAVTSTVALTACGGNVTFIGNETDSGGASDSGSTTDAGGGSDGGNGNDTGGGSGDSGGGGTDGGGGGPVCPVSQPPQGGACSPIGAQCEYGNDPNASCDLIVSCTGTGWQYPPPGPPPNCPMGMCPASYATVPVGAQCTPNDLTCAYPEGTCLCSIGAGPVGMYDHWICYPAQNGCPSPRPRIGSACTQPGLSCDYGACAGGVELQCTGGYWQPVNVPCPV